MNQCIFWVWCLLGAYRYQWMNESLYMPHLLAYPQSILCRAGLLRKRSSVGIDVMSDGEDDQGSRVFVSQESNAVEARSDENSDLGQASATTLPAQQPSHNGLGRSPPPRSHSSQIREASVAKVAELQRMLGQPTQGQLSHRGRRG